MQSAWRKAKPSIALLSNGGNGNDASMSCASTRPWQRASASDSVSSRCCAADFAERCPSLRRTTGQSGSQSWAVRCMAIAGASEVVGRVEVAEAYAAKADAGHVQYAPAVHGWRSRCWPIACAQLPARPPHTPQRDKRLRAVVVFCECAVCRGVLPDQGRHQAVIDANRSTGSVSNHGVSHPRERIEARDGAEVARKTIGDRVQTDSPRNGRGAIGTDDRRVDFR